MNYLNFKRRLLGVLGAAALGFSGAAWAQDSQLEQEMDNTAEQTQQTADQAKQTGEEAAQQTQQAGEEAIGGAGQAGQEAAQQTQQAGQEAAQQTQQGKEKAIGGAGQVGQGLSTAAQGAGQEVSQAAQGVESRAENIFEGRAPNPALRVTGEVGISNWAGRLGEALNTGPQWGVNVGTQVYNLLGLEVGYNGQRNAIADQFGAAPNAAVFRHGLDALAKVGPVLENGLHPYGGIGFGLALVNPNKAADPVIQNDLLAELPVAAGLDYDSGMLTAGLRGSWRWTFGEQFAKPLLGERDEGSIFGASLMFGGRF